MFPKNWGNWVTNESTDVIGSLSDANKRWKCTSELMALTAKDSLYARPARRPRQRGGGRVIDGRTLLSTTRQRIGFTLRKPLWR